MQETLVQSLGQADLLEKEMATHSRILAWKIPWTEEPGGLWSVRGVAKSQTRLSDFPFTFLLRQCQVGTFYMVHISAPGNTISQHHLKFVPLWASLFCHQTQQFVHHHSLTFLQFSSFAQSCPALCDPMNRGTPGLPVHHQLQELTQIHVHQVGDAIQPSHPLSSPSPPPPNLSQHQGLFQWVSSSHELVRVLELQLQHQSFQWIVITDFL